MKCLHSEFTHQFPSTGQTCVCQRGEVPASVKPNGVHLDIGAAVISVRMKRGGALVARRAS